MQNKEIYFRDGSIILYDSWISDAEIRSINLTKKSRKEYTCIFGCNISVGVSYLRIDLIDGNCSGVSMVELAFCQEHLKLFNLIPEFNDIENSDIDGQDIVNLVRER